MRFGTDEQQERFLRRSPAAKLSLRSATPNPTPAPTSHPSNSAPIKDGDDYILNGIKRFTSGAHRSEYVWLATRTDTDAPKHRGVSMMLVDMKSPGITVRPLWTMAGYRTNEVYFEDVRVPTNVLVGEENQGWYYAAHALDRERISIFTVSSVRAVYDRLIDWAKSDTPMGRPIDDPAILREFADFKVQLEVLQHLSYRILDMLKREESPNYEASQVKIFSTEMMQRLQNFGLHAMGLYGQLTSDDTPSPHRRSLRKRLPGRRHAHLRCRRKRTAKKHHRPKRLRPPKGVAHFPSFQAPPGNSFLFRPRLDRGPARSPLPEGEG